MTKLLFAFALLVVCSCDKPADQSLVSPAQDKGVRFKENVALFDFRARAVDPANFVKELVFADFSEEGVLGKAIVFEGIAFTDDGKQFDRKAGDGVFAAVEKQPYNESVKAGTLTGSQPKSFLDAPIVNASFKKSAELSTYQATTQRYIANEPNARAALPPVYICDVEYGGNHCRAAQWGWCQDCCVLITNCRWVRIGI